jgi:hypothetical protein
MPLQLPPPLQTPLHTGQGPLQEPSNPPTANDVVRATANACLVLGTYSMYYTIAQLFCYANQCIQIWVVLSPLKKHLQL